MGGTIFRIQNLCLPNESFFSTSPSLLFTSGINTRNLSNADCWGEVQAEQIEHVGNKKLKENSYLLLANLSSYSNSTTKIISKFYRRAK